MKYFIHNIQRLRNLSYKEKEAEKKKIKSDMFINEPRDLIFDRSGVLFEADSTAKEHETPATRSRLISVMCVRTMPC